MRENGWDLQNIHAKKRLVMTEEACWNLLDTIDKHKWMVQQWATSSISTSFWSEGKAMLKFGNCFNEGKVTVFLDGKEIGNSSHSKDNSKTVTFNVAAGSILDIKTDDRSIIRLFELNLECGKYMNTLINM